jgi:hypothetical protein
MEHERLLGLYFYLFLYCLFNIAISFSDWSVFVRRSRALCEKELQVIRKGAGVT